MSLYYFGKCMPLTRRLEMSMVKIIKNYRSNVFSRKCFLIGGTALASLVIIASPAECSSDNEPKPANKLDPGCDAAFQEWKIIFVLFVIFVTVVKVQNQSTSADPVESFINQYGEAMQKLGFGGLMGICTGVAFKRLGNQAAYAIGLGFVGVQALSYLGYIKIDYKKVTDDAQKLADLNGDGKFDSKDLACLWLQVKRVLTFNLPSAGGFASGVMLGLYFGN